MTDGRQLRSPAVRFANCSSVQLLERLHANLLAVVITVLMLAALVGMFLLGTMFPVLP